jgi:copper chaperone CopZ
MKIQSRSDERTGMLRISDGVDSDRMARAIKAGLGDLPGVYNVEVIGSSVRVRFVPTIVTEQQFYQAIKTAGFQASGFQRSE